MLYVFTGTDNERVVRESGTLIEQLQKKRPDAELFELNTEALARGSLDELVSAQTLFSPKYIVLIHDVNENKESFDVLARNVKPMHAAEHVFVIRDQSLPRTLIEKVKQAGATVRVYDVKKATAASFNVFSLADALSARDRRTLWTRLQEARAAGLAPESIHGALFWQAKNIVLAHTTGSPEEAGMKAFPYTKAKRATQHYTLPEARALTDKLVLLVSEARRGHFELDSALERFTLSVEDAFRLRRRRGASVRRRR